VSEAEGREIAREGCLSVPDVTANVRRATRIVVEHAGGRVECLDFEARAVQHEIDHLDGVLFLDRVDSLVEDVFRRRDYSERAAEGCPDPSASRGERTADSRRKASPPDRTG
jgi:peptide deformylase